MTSSSPAPLDRVRDKLAAPDEESRIVALIHAAAHGQAAKDLAATVAAMLTDPSESVRWHCVGTFRAIGAGASDAVEPLVAHLDSDDMRLIVRACACLETVGPAAHDAIDPLVAAIDTEHGARPALEALIAIAPDDERVARAFVETAFADPYFATSRTTGPLPASLTSALFVELRDRARAGVDLAQAALLLPRVAQTAGDELTELLRIFLSSDEPSAHAGALPLLASIEPPPDDLLSAARRLAAEEGPIRANALRALGSIESFDVEELLTTAIEDNFDADPVPGLAGEPARLVATAADIAATHSETALVGPLCRWTGAFLQRANDLSTVSWYPVGDIAESLARLAPADDSVHDLLTSLVAAARAHIDRDHSGVLDFERAIRRAFEATDATDKLFTRAADLGMPRRDPYAYEAPADEPPPSLPPFPAAKQPAPEPIFIEWSDDQLDALMADVARGRTLVDAPDSAEDTIAAIEHWLRSVGELVDDEVGAVGAAFGDALVNALDWRWGAFVEDGERYAAVAPADDAFVVLVDIFVDQQLRRGRDLTVILFFNMLKAGKTPPRTAGRLLVLG